jgi:uncharacterized protein GlcG (DUF336 family)
MTTIADSIAIDQAARAIAAAQTHAAAVGAAANIAVLDAGTHLKGFVRMDGAVLGSIDLSIGKARTAALFAMSRSGCGTTASPMPRRTTWRPATAASYPSPGACRSFPSRAR